MKKAILLAMALSLVAGSALAYDTAGRIGLGFSNANAPLGVRFWMSDQLGFDAGIGYRTANDGDNTYITLEAGVPFRLISARDRANLNVRPRIMYQAIDTTPATNDSQMSLGAELEVEVFLTNDFAVRASHGVAINIISPNVGDSTTDIGTTAGNFTGVGFYFYFP